MGTLVQTKLTCETGPGVPSGHSQATAVIWFCLVDTVTGCLGRGKVLGWLIFLSMQMSMFLSRIYIAAHFPHQCLLGFLVGLDPNWSISLAKKHCLKSEWIYVDTTPFYAMMRFSGSAVGLSLSGYLTMEVFSSPKLATKVFAMMLGLGLGQLSNLIHQNIPRDNLDYFYLMEFLLNAFFVIIVIKMFQIMFG